MAQKKRIVAILIVSYNGREYLERCLGSIFDDVYESIEKRVFVVDNASTDDTVAYVTRAWSQVRVVRSDSNRGYAGGNTLGWKVILEELQDIEYVFLLNQDTFVEKGFLDPLVTYLDLHRNAAAAQPRLMLFPETNRINSLGNVIHFLGLGYSSFNGTVWHESDSYPVSIGYASGAALLLRRSAIDRIGLFDDFMFMYLEDLDLGWRMLLAGYDIGVVRNSAVYHRYEFLRGQRQYYFFERNRLWILLKNYRIATLVLLLPSWFFLELGILAAAIANGHGLDKLRAYGYFFKPSSLAALARDRRRTQALRSRNDRALIRVFSGTINFQPLHGALLRYVANPVLRVCHLILKNVVFW